MEKEYIVMEKQELKDLIYKESKSANDKLFSGLSPFLYRAEDNFHEVLKELDYIKAAIRSGVGVSNNTVVQSEPVKEQSQGESLKLKEIREKLHGKTIDMDEVERARKLIDDYVNSRIAGDSNE